MKIRVSQAAERHLNAIGTYISAHAPHAAGATVGKIRATADLLRTFPFIGHPGVDPGTREWRVRGLPYVLVYEVRPDRAEVLILAVFHGAQDRPPGE